MNWFLALNEHAFRSDRYAEMLKVAVHTALQTTSLVPHVLYDGRESALTTWLTARGVRIIPCRTFAHEGLAAISRQRHDPNILAIGAGAFLRVEIPSIASQLGMRGEYVLYTDLDVMFTGEVSGLLTPLTPKYFAVGPEFDRHDARRMNSGVMLMNVGSLCEVDAEFRRFITVHLRELVDQNWDQGAYRRFFGRSAVVSPVRGPRWDALPPELNWKPHWGSNPCAPIIHFHGPKPHDRELMRSGQMDDHVKWMTAFSGGAYDELADRWYRTLADCEA